MKLTIQIKEIDFCEVILKAMPILQEKHPMMQVQSPKLFLW